MAKRQSIVIVIRSENARGRIPSSVVQTSCDICSVQVMIQRTNLEEQRRKYEPVLVCMECYGNGEHIRAGYGR